VRVTAVGLSVVAVVTAESKVYALCLVSEGESVGIELIAVGTPCPLLLGFSVAEMGHLLSRSNAVPPALGREACPVPGKQRPGMDSVVPVWWWYLHGRA
jgi:hypothetical protein